MRTRSTLSMKNESLTDQLTKMSNSKSDAPTADTSELKREIEKLQES